MIFNIQKCSIHDGDGLRTLVFLKGCPLHCLWLTVILSSTAVNAETVSDVWMSAMLNPKI